MFIGPPTPVVQLSASNENSLSFAWTEYQPCNTRNESKATYEFVFRDSSSWSVIQMGSTTDTVASFTNLNPNTEYRMEVLVNLKSLSASLSSYSSTLYSYTERLNTGMQHVIRYKLQIIYITSLL